MNPLDVLTDDNKAYFVDVLWNTTYDDDTKSVLENQIWDAEIWMDIDIMVERLFLNQADPILCGKNYSQTDWVKHRRKYD